MSPGMLLGSGGLEFTAWQGIAALALNLDAHLLPKVGDCQSPTGRPQTGLGQTHRTSRTVSVRSIDIESLKPCEAWHQAAVNLSFKVSCEQIPMPEMVN